MQANFDEFPGFSRLFDEISLTAKIAAINRRNFVTPIVSFRAIICAAQTFERTFERKFGLLEILRRFFERILHFFCQFSSISGQCFAAFKIRLDINHLCGAVVRMKSSCNPSAYEVSRSTQPILGNCCVKLTWLFCKEGPTVYYP